MDLVSFINEHQGSLFKEEVKYTKADWEKWKKTRPDEIYVGTDDDYKDLELVYIVNHNTRTVDHIASYNPKTQVLFCDDIKMFGHEVK